MQELFEFNSELKRIIWPKNLLGIKGKKKREEGLELAF